MTDYNSMAFTPEEVQKGMHLELLSTLLKLNSEKEDSSYYDIHITSDGYCTIIEWYDRDPEYGAAGFKFVGDEEVVMLEKLFPDNHYETFYSEDDYKESLDDWLKDNPGWIKNEYGGWTNEIENKKFREDMKKQMEKTSDSTGHDWVINDIPEKSDEDK